MENSDIRVKIAILEERINSLKSEQKEIKKDLAELREWARDNFKRVWDKENKDEKKGNFMGSLFKIGG